MMNRRTKFILCALALLAVLLLPFAVMIRNSSSFGPDSIIESVRAEHELVRLFDSRFPSARHFISYFTGEYGPPTWNSVADTPDGRFEIHLQFPLTINHAAGVWTTEEPAQLLILTIDQVRSSGRSRMYSGQKSWLLNADDASQLRGILESNVRAPTP